MNAKETLTSWLAYDKLEWVIKGLRITSEKWGSKELMSNINFQSGRYIRLKDDQLKGLISHSDYSIELAKIRQSLHDIVDKLAEHWTAEGLETVPPTLSDRMTASHPVTYTANNLTKSQLSKLLYERKFEEVFKLILVKAESFGDDDIYYQVKRLCDSWNLNMEMIELNPQGFPDFADKQNGILEKILQLNNQMEEGNSKTNHPIIESKSEWKKWAIILGSILAGLGAFSEFSGWNLRDILGVKRDDSMQLTVYVQDTEGKPIPALQNTSHVIVRFDNDLRDPVVGENGRTNMGEIPTKFQGQEIEVVLVAEGWELTTPGKKYKMDGGQIYLTVKRDNSLGTIQGIVQTRDGSDFIAGALVMIDHDTTVWTDSLGRFRLLLPEKMHKESYLLTVKKVGFKEREEMYRPKSTPADIRLEIIDY